MANQVQQATRYFNSYEEREEAFRNCALSLIPRKHLGPGPFWRDFKGLSRDGFSSISRTPMAFVTSNPRDCLSFGTPRQVLAAACLRGRHDDSRYPFTVAQIATDFALAPNLNQPVRTLSGGETVKLALAKSMAIAPCTTRLVVASPFTWLSQDNITYFRRVFHHYRELDLPVEILALQGEDDNRPIEPDKALRIRESGCLGFTARLSGVCLDLGTSFNTLYSHHTTVAVEDFSARLSSPCLLVGENGQGKSLVAKTMAGAIAFSGAVEIDSGGGCHRVRLLFQDVVAQTLLRSFDALAGASGDREKARTLGIYREILGAVNAFTATTGADNPPSSGKDQASVPLTLLQIKAILMAARLCRRPCALILDEPDWGMTRSDAIAFVAAIIRVAHGRGVPVMIISHKPWWSTIAGDKIQVTRTATEVRGERASTFRITLRRAHRGHGGGG